MWMDLPPPKQRLHWAEVADAVRRGDGAAVRRLVECSMALRPEISGGVF